MGVTSLIPVVVNIPTIGGHAEVPMARELLLDKIALSTGALTSGTFQAQIKKNGSVVGGPVTVSAAGMRVWEDLAIPFEYADLLRIETSGVPVGVTDVYITLWLRMDIS